MDHSTKHILKREEAQNLGITPEQIARMPRAYDDVYFLKDICAHIPDGISVVDAQYTILFSNAGMGKICHTSSSLAGKKCYQAYHNKPHACLDCPAQKTFRTGKNMCAVMPRTGSNGVPAGWLGVSTFPLFDAVNGTIYAIIEFTRDITAHKETERKLHQSLDKMQRVLNETVSALASTLETKDPYTAGHQQRVRALACAIAKELGLYSEQINGLYMAAAVHDIGKIYVPVEILNKPAHLSDIEFSIIKTHPKLGYDILKGIEFPWPIARIVHQHHERIGGSGYPSGLSGDEIIIEARILAVADIVEAMASHRPYRPALGVEKALHEIKQNRDILYDAAVVDACLKIFEKKIFHFE